MKKVLLFLILILSSNYSFSQLHSVTFRVDMNIQMAYGMFDPSMSEVSLRGSFNEWIDTDYMNDDDGDGIYELTKDDIPSSSIAYKFYYNNVQGQPAWEEIDDRTLDVVGDIVLPVVYFMNDPGNKAVINVTFMVNMEIEAVAGRFDSENDIVTVRGNFNGWEGTDTCKAESSEPYKFTKIVKYLGEVGDVIHYKFNVNGDRWENDFPLNDGGHRLIEITNENVVSETASDPFDYPNEYFNGLDVSELTEDSCEIKFVVDMNGATDLNGTPFSAIENVILCGETAPLFWAWDTLDRDKAIYMFDDGTNGDETADDNFWTVKVTFPKFTTTNPFSFKYGANYDLESNNGINDNENYAGDDHWMKLDKGLISGTMNNVFGTAATSDNPHPLEDVVTDIKQNEIMPLEYKLFQNYPNPFNPSTTIKFSIPENSEVSVRVYNILGKKIAELMNGNFTPGSYEFQFNSNIGGVNLASGIYFLRFEANKYSQTVKMMLMK